jgi:hypothetical protein
MSIGDYKNKSFIILCTTPGLKIKLTDLMKLNDYRKDVNILFVISSIGISNEALKFAINNQIEYLKLDKNGSINIFQFINKFYDLELS